MGMYVRIIPVRFVFETKQVKQNYKQYIPKAQKPKQQDR